LCKSYKAREHYLVALPVAKSVTSAYDTRIKV
jgi:hypothetical protein